MLNSLRSGVRSETSRRRMGDSLLRNSRNNSASGAGSGSLSSSRPATARASRFRMLPAASLMNTTLRFASLTMIPSEIALKMTSRNAFSRSTCAMKPSNCSGSIFLILLKNFAENALAMVIVP